MEESELRMLLWAIGDDSLAPGCSEASVASSVAQDGESGESDDESEGDARPDRDGRRNNYRNDFKVRVLDELHAGGSITAIARRRGIKCRTGIYGWVKNEAKIREACEKKKRSKGTVGGQGRHRVFPYCDELIQWIKQMRRDDFPLKTSHCVVFVKEEYEEWATAYLKTRREESLCRAVRRMTVAHGFSFRRPTRTVLSSEELVAEQQRFAADVGVKVTATYDRNCIFNADETAVYYDDDPGTIIAERGRKKSARIKGRRRSERASVLLIVSATGKKLRPLIIFKGQPGGTIEKDMDDYSDQVVTTVQRNGWMDSTVWIEKFINDQWAGFVSEETPGPLTIYVDNLKCHVSEEAQEAFAAWGTEVVALPENTTAILQPLDVGVMGPFKQKLRSLTLSYELDALRRQDRVPLRERLLALKRMSADEKRKLLVDRVTKAWDGVSEDCIRRAWEKSGL